MILKILKVKKGTYGMREGVIHIWDYWVLVKTETGQEMEIFDLDPLNLEGYEGKSLDCLICPMVGDIDEDTEFIIRGRFIKNYELPSKWKGIHDPVENYDAVETEYGIFLLDPGIIEFQDKEGQIIEFDGFRLDLLAYLPLD